MNSIAGLKIVGENASNWICYCPFHKDTNTPNFYIVKSGPYYGRFKCFACGKYGHINELDKNFKGDNMPKKRPLINFNWERLNSDYVSNLTKFNGKESLCDEFDVSHDILSVYQCGWDSECYTFPLRDDCNNIIGIQRRFPDGKKRMITGSRTGLFLPQGINVLRNQWIFVCEGLSDTVTCANMGFFAIGRMSATTGTMLLCRLLKGKNVVIVGDNDKAGLDAAYKLDAKLRRLCNVKTVFPREGKDLREWYKKDGENVRKVLTKLTE